MKLSNFNVGIDQPLFLIAGPCVIESEDMTLSVADELKNICIKLDIPFIFKSSFDKANRSSNSTFRGFGMEEGLRILEKVKDQFEVPVLTDIHTSKTCFRNCRCTSNPCLFVQTNRFYYCCCKIRKTSKYKKRTISSST